MAKETVIAKENKATPINAIRPGLKLINKRGTILEIARINGDYVEFKWDRKKELLGSGTWLSELQEDLASGGLKIIK